jgi:hypothetical protein
MEPHSKGSLAGRGHPEILHLESTKYLILGCAEIRAFASQDEVVDVELNVHVATTIDAGFLRQRDEAALKSFVHLFEPELR